MNENAKKVLLVCVILVALVAAGLGAKKAIGGDEIIWHGSREVPPGAKSMKEIEMEKQNADPSRAGNAAGGKEVDLAGPTSGN